MREAYSCDFCALDRGRRGCLFVGGGGESELAVEAGEQAGEVGGDDAGGRRQRLVGGEGGGGWEGANVHGGRLGGGCGGFCGLRAGCGNERAAESGSEERRHPAPRPGGKTIVRRREPAKNDSGGTE